MLSIKVRLNQFRVRLKSRIKRTEELDEYKVHVKTKQFAEEVAKEKFGLIYPNELVLKPEKISCRFTLCDATAYFLLYRGA